MRLPLTYTMIILNFSWQVVDANDRNRFEHRRQVFGNIRRRISVGFWSAQPSARSRLLRNRSTSLSGPTPSRQAVPSAVPRKWWTIPSTVLRKRRTVPSTVPGQWWIVSSAIPALRFPSRSRRGGGRLPAAELHRAGTEFHIATRRPEVRSQTAVRSIVRY